VARSCNHCCSGNAERITYSDYEIAALGIQHAMRMSHIVICGLAGCTKFFLSKKGTIFGGKKSY
jgi:hypothetical protein